jgi:peptidoglycan/LPS O-acetylase OafA/YrhL
MAAILIFLIDPFLSQRWRGIYLLPVGTTLEGVCIALLLLWAVRAEGVAGRILNAKPLVHLGVISYSLYLWQQLFANAEASPLGQFPINLIGCFLAAEVSYRLIERPFLRLRQRVFPSPASSLPPLRLGEGRGNLD